MKKTKNMTIYICGKIGDDSPSPEVLYKFKKAEEMLLSKGYEVFNPTTSGLGAHAESLAQRNGTSFWEEIMLLDLEELKKCEGIYVLDDCETSYGARTEIMYARGAKKKIFFQTLIDAHFYLGELFYEISMSQATGPYITDQKMMKDFINDHIKQIYMPLY